MVSYLNISSKRWSTNGKEFDTYKVGTVANSCSTMHKIQAKEFTLEDFSCEHLYSGQVDETRTFSLEKGNIEGWSNQAFYTPLDILKATIEILNAYRTNYLDSHEKEDWWQMIQLLPSSYNQRRTVQLNYEVLAHMYHDRKDHKLDEWREFCKTIETLPYAKELIIGEPSINNIGNAKFMGDGSVMVNGVKYIPFCPKMTESE